MKKNYLFIFLAAISLGMPVAAQAGIVTKTFMGTIMDGARMGDEVTGSFSYEENDVIVGDEFLTSMDGLTVSFVFDGQNFNESHDFDFPNFPELGFFGFEPDTLDYLLVNGANGVDFVDPQLETLGMFFLNPGTGSYDFNIDIDATYVPIPAAFWMLCSGVIGLVALRRKSKV